MNKKLILGEVLASQYVGPISAYSLHELRAHPLLRTRPGIEKDYRKYVLILSRIQSIKDTLRRLEQVLERNFDLDIVYTQSGEFVGQETGPIDYENVVENENLLEVTGNPNLMVSAGRAQAPDAGQRGTLFLEDFLSRPVEIGDFNLPLATNITLRFKVWDQFLSNPSVRAKIRNFAFLRGDLHVRVSISGTPFHYGRVMLSYQAYADNNDCLQAHIGNLALQPVNWRPLYLCYLSQAPGTKTMGVNENEPVEMVIPYIGVKPMMRLYNTSAAVISDVTPLNDADLMGELHFVTLNQLQCAAATPSIVAVQIYAWMENVEVSCPTGTQLAITTESGEFKDERKVGPVENVASSAASVLTKLSYIPYLTPYAKASAMVATGIGRIAALMGWSYPSTINPISRVHPEPFSNGAQTIGVSSSKRITLDPRQELCVDGNVVAIQEDDMSIANLCRKESYIYTFAWNDDDLPLTGTIFKSRVNPQLGAYWFDGVVEFFQPSALAFAVSPFVYWRGTIKFRFEIVVSAYHRGKLAFYFEPNLSQQVLIDADLSMNKQFMRVIDIQETQSVTFCVNWASPRMWLETCPPAGMDLNIQNFSTTSHAIENCNGYIGVTPFTKLQSPDNSDVQVNVYVSSDDMHVNQYTDLEFPTTRDILTQSGEFDNNALSNLPVTCMDLNPSTATNDNICDLHFGEQPLSYRALLKRFNTTHRLSYGSSAGTFRTVLAKFMTLPVPNGDFGAGPSTTTSLFGYLRYAYLGWRGGIVKRIFPYFTTNMDIMSTAKVQLEIAFANDPSYSIAEQTTPVHTTARGCTVYMTHTNAGVEAEIPFYTDNLYGYSFSSNQKGIVNVGDYNPRWTRRYEVSFDIDGTTSNGYVYEDSAAGEDFAFLLFSGAPYFSQ